MNSLAKKLSSSEISNLKNFILPDIDLETLQKSISDEELLITLYFFSLDEAEYLLALAVDKENDQVIVQSMTPEGFYFFLKEMRHELSSEEFLNYPSQSLLEFSDTIFADFKEIMQENLGKVMTPSTTIYSSLCKMRHNP